MCWSWVVARANTPLGWEEQNPDRNYIGIDIKGSRMYLGLKYARDHDLKNIAFIRTRINLIHMCFGPGEVSEIWITFPDPQARDTKAKKRLTSPWFLNSYSKFLKPGGIINVKTDNIIFYDSTLDVIEADGHELLFKTEDVYNEGFDNELTQIQTYYEKKWLEHGTKIKYIKFRLKQDG